MTVPDLLATFLWATKGVLIVVSACFLISGCDDFFVDLYHAVRTMCQRVFEGRRPEAVTTTQLSDAPEQPIAVMIPAWDEGSIIRQMLETNLARVDYGNLHIFVGTYPNDPATQREVEIVSRHYPNVHRIICPHIGPTNKSDCLNSVYREILAHEKAHGIRFEVFALNDSEDVIHPQCFKLFNRLVPRFDMVQIPVIPLEAPWWHFTAGHYLDEFAEIHGKEMVVRQSLTGTIPAAGVGCAFSRRALALAATDADELFSTDSLAEDYDLGMRLGALGLKQAFVRTAIRTERAISGARSDASSAYIAIGEYFPSSFSAAVRQKARWIIGIAFQGWRKLGWRGNLRMKYALLRDRRASSRMPPLRSGMAW